LSKQYFVSDCTLPDVSEGFPSQNGFRFPIVESSEKGL